MQHGYLSDRVSFQQTVDANVNFNAREGRSTVEVCKQLIILLCMFFHGNMLELVMTGNMYSRRSKRPTGRPIVRDGADKA